MAIVEPTGLENEEVLDIPVSEMPCKVVSGYANFLFAESDELGGPIASSDAPKGIGLGDEKWGAYEIHMVVGPRWRGVRDVSPSVILAGYTFNNSDTANDSGYHIDTCTWDTVGLPPPDTDFERIRLKVKMRVRGGPGFGVTKLRYQLFAKGQD